MEKGKRCLCIVMTIIMILSVAVPAITVSAVDNETTIYNFLKNTMGFNTAAACGVLGNISVESSFLPTAHNSGENAWGICQWEGSRLTNLKNRYPSSWQTLDSQIGFLKWELEGGDYSGPGTVSHLKNVSNSADGASDAAKYFAQYFERCASSTYSTRMSRAKNTYWPKYYVDPLYPDTRYPVPFKCRLISTLKERCYNDSEKTSSPGYIYPEDDCNIIAIYTNGLVKCECPWSDGSTKTVYIDKSEFINSSMAPSSMTAPQYGVTYLRSDASTNMGWIDPGDSITKVATSGNMTQIIYPRGDGGLRCAWVFSSVLEQPDVLDWPEFVCRTISTEKVVCYNDLDYSSSPGKIYPEDDCTITAVYRNGKVQCRCPWYDGTTKTVYVDRSVFIPFSTTSLIQMTASKYCVTYLRSSDTSASWGWIDEGDTIYKIGVSGNMTQVLYPKGDGGLRCGWVYSSELIKSYTISYNANGGQNAPGNQIKNHGESLELSSTIPTRYGYTFLGWSESSTATFASYLAGGVLTSNGDITLYAVWKANQYNVSYNANGGQNAPEPQVKTYGVTLTLSATQPARVGYTFLGWATTPDATAIEYSAGSSYTTNSTVTLFAVWTPNTYYVHYNANGGTGTMVNSPFVFDNAEELSSNQFVKQGYLFKGWATSADSLEVVYTDGQYILNLSSEQNDIVNLYAVWEEAMPEYVSGDINGDNTVNNKDLTRLMKYLAGEDVSVQDVALDINGDGNVNNIDLTRLMKYLAGEDVTIY